MTEVATPLTKPPVGTFRLALGLVVAVLVVAVATVFTLGLFNPWELVVLKRHFANSWVGLAAVAAGAYLAVWLIVPIRDEARQSGWIAVRVALAAITVLGLILGGLLGPQYRYEVSELARSADGERTLALVIVGGLQERQLQVWEGTGLGAREMGSLGRPCTRVRARFAGPDLVIIDQGHGEWPIRLDPHTGVPQQVLAVRCSEPPVPATLEP
jgi:hypothetical protein